jgi:cell shape-determining protein MreC
MFEDHQVQDLAMETHQRSGNSSAEVSMGDPEVVAQRTRRRRTVSYKLKVLETVASLRSQGNGAVGAFLRKEGLYYSSVRRWEQLQTEGKLTANSRGSKQKSREELLAEIKQLRRKNEQLQKRLEKTELIVELQKKLSSIIQAETDEASEKPNEP